jgi:hypothetical protein
MSTATIPQPPVAFAFYCYASDDGSVLAPPARTPDDAWKNAVALVRNFYDESSPDCGGDGDLAEVFGHPPTAAEVEAAILEDLGSYTVLLTISAPDDARAFAWLSRGSSAQAEQLREEWHELGDVARM